MAALFLGQDAAQCRLASEIRGFAGPDIARIVQEIVRGANRPRTGAVATLAGVATLAFGASSIFVELHDAMNAIWKVPRRRDRTNTEKLIRLMRDRFYSFLTVLGAGFLLLASLLLNAGVTAMKISVPRPVRFLNRIDIRRRGFADRRAALGILLSATILLGSRVQ